MPHTSSEMTPSENITPSENTTPSGCICNSPLSYIPLYCINCQDYFFSPMTKGFQRDHCPFHNSNNIYSLSVKPWVSDLCEKCVRDNYTTSFDWKSTNKHLKLNGVDVEPQKVHTCNLLRYTMGVCFVCPRMWYEPMDVTLMKFLCNACDKSSKQELPPYVGVCAYCQSEGYKVVKNDKYDPVKYYKNNVEIPNPKCWID